MHMALRYGITQALLHATAVSGRETMAEVVAREYGATISETPIAILASGHRDDPLQLDRTILKRPELLPHASFTTVEHVGRSGEKLLAFADTVATRLRQIGGSDYRPRIHLDVYGTLGELFADDIDKIAAYLATLVKTVQPYGFLIESPIIARTQREQIELFRKLGQTLRKNGTEIGLIADEWCNTLEDVRLFTDEKAAGFPADQDTRPRRHQQQHRGRAALQAARRGRRRSAAPPTRPTSRRGSARMSLLACRPDFMPSKPGLGAWTEALMIQRNEMGRTLALLKAQARTSMRRRSG